MGSRRHRRPRWHWIVVTAALVVAGCSSAAVSPATTGPAAVDPNPFRIGRPLVIPHGGGDGMFPEDTLYAYEHSIALGGDVVDADVQTTADGIPIAFHDPTLDRTTNGTGNVEDTSSATIAGLDAGWGFMLDGEHPFRGKGITVPTIESLLARFPNRLVTLDLKDLRTSAVAPLCALLQRTGRTGDVYIGVDTTEQVDRFRALCPEVHTSGTDAERAAMRAARTSGDTSFTTTQLVSQPQYIGPDGSPRVTRESLAFSHQHDIAVLTWVVDDPVEMTQLIEEGVDGIYTRRPDVLVALLHKMGLRSAAPARVGRRGDGRGAVRARARDAPTLREWFAPGLKSVASEDLRDGR